MTPTPRPPRDHPYRRALTSLSARGSGLRAQWAARTPSRTYLALARGSPPDDAGTINVPLTRSDRDFTLMRAATWRDEKPLAATTHWAVERRFSAPAPLTLLRCTLETGRTHQARVSTSRRNSHHHSSFDVSSL